MKKGDRVYLYSDGFADQFEGEKGKKFKYKTLKELILSAQEVSMNEQYGSIRNAFYDWKREFEQIDDVCLMGVEVYISISSLTSSSIRSLFSTR